MYVTDDADEDYRVDPEADNAASEEEMDPEADEIDEIDGKIPSTRPTVLFRSVSSSVDSW